ncbi:MAG: Peptide-methionine (S)-S-oxide reductase [Thelocarpon superellum]|nr:MAG: Peptide-methionine (S)-S-oxide reductase [Thelocarpon superellum]
MSASMPLFLTRLFRPFTSSTRLGLNPDGSSASATASTMPEGAEKATVAAGCFWGVEHIFRKHYDGKGLLDAKVGYIGGDTKNPSYRAVCSGRTGHAEALQIIFDPTRVSYRELLELFYKMHDPTTKNRQGGDAGTQYRSGIFYHDAEQEKVARDVTERVQKEWWRAGSISTEIAPAGEWYDAETYHQLYLDKNPGGYECPAHYVRSFPPLSTSSS